MYMYNRYTPQSDGTYRRKTIQMPRNNVPTMPREEPVPIPMEENKSFPPAPQHKEFVRTQAPARRPEISAGTFLKQLLPKNLDTGDLLIIILLLLMASDSGDDQGNALFTLALYLFM